MPTSTTNYGFQKPLVNDPTDEDLWGGYLNGNFDDIDTELYTLSLLSGSTVPIGAGMDFWGTVAPAGWLFPYGQDIDRTTYADLFAVIGTTYGVGDGSTTFTLPDKRDRASFGKGDMGGTPANRITDQDGGWEGDTLGDTGGAQTKALSSANNGPHTHDQTNLTSTSGTADGVIREIGSGTNTSDLDTGSSGSGTPFGILPPGIVCNYIIFAGV